MQTLYSLFRSWPTSLIPAIAAANPLIDVGKIAKPILPISLSRGKQISKSRPGASPPIGLTPLVSCAEFLDFGQTVASR
jgi:hypothetical protein